MPCENQYSQKTLLVGVVWYRIPTLRWCSVDPPSDLTEAQEYQWQGPNPLSAWHDTQTSFQLYMQAFYKPIGTSVVVCGPYTGSFKKGQEFMPKS